MTSSPPPVYLAVRVAVVTALVVVASPHLTAPLRLLSRGLLVLGGVAAVGLSVTLPSGAVAGIVFTLAMVFVFLFLAAQYESWSMPFMVILAVPLALFGAVAALWARGMQFDV